LHLVNAKPHAMIIAAIVRNKQNIIYGIALALLLLLLKWLEWHFVIADHAVEMYSSAIAVVFTALGVWLALKLMKPKVKTIVVEKPVAADAGFTLNEVELRQLRISSRELEVLQLMAEGLSNQEIAERLFVSLNTIKTHSSNLFVKMEVERRTQAVEKAKRLSLIP
jgi:DNA-binding CsgD family transcriptional regulator